MKLTTYVAFILAGAILGFCGAQAIARELERDDPPGMEPLCTPETRRVCTDFVLSCPLHEPHGTD